MGTSQTSASIAVPSSPKEDGHWWEKAQGVGSLVSIPLSIAALILAVRANQTARKSTVNGLVVKHAEDFGRDLSNIRTEYRALLGPHKSKLAKAKRAGAWTELRDKFDAKLDETAKVHDCLDVIRPAWLELLDEDNAYCTSPALVPGTAQDRARDSYEAKHNAVMACVRQCIKRMS